MADLTGLIKFLVSQGPPVTGPPATIPPFATTTTTLPTIGGMSYEGQSFMLGLAGIVCAFLIIFPFIKWSKNK